MHPALKQTPTSSAPWRTCWRIYHRPYNKKRPAGLPGRGQQAIGGRGRIAAAAADRRQPRTSTTNTYRNGTANLFMISEPLPGGQLARGSNRTTDRRNWTFAEVFSCAGWSITLHAFFTTPRRSCWCMDNLNTHIAGPLSTRPSFARAGAADHRTAGNPSHAQAWELAQRGRDRVRACCRGSAWTGGWHRAPELRHEVLGLGWRSGIELARSRCAGVSPQQMPASSFYAHSTRPCDGGRRLAGIADPLEIWLVDYLRICPPSFVVEKAMVLSASTASEQPPCVGGCSMR